MGAGRVKGGDSYGSFSMRNYHQQQYAYSKSQIFPMANASTLRRDAS